MYGAVRDDVATGKLRNISYGQNTETPVLKDRCRCRSCLIIRPKTVAEGRHPAQDQSNGGS